MKSRPLSVRRWGVSAVAGITLLGAAAIIGEGVASASTPTVSATSASVVTIPGSGSQIVGGSITLSVTGTIQTGDVIYLTLSCPTSGTLSWDTHTSITTASPNWTVGAPSSSGSCGTSENVLPITAGAGALSSIVVAPQFDASGATSGSVTMSGVYSQLGTTSSFSVPSDATINWFSVTSNVPAVTLGSKTTTSISNISISQPANLTAGANIAAGSISGSTATITPGAKAADGLVVSTTTIPAGSVNASYSTTLAASGGATSYNWAMTPASLDGLSIASSTGLLSGTLGATAGQYTGTVTVTDGNGDSATAAIVLTVGSGTPSIELTLPTGDTWAGTPTATVSQSNDTATFGPTGTNVLDVALSANTTTSTLINISGLQVTTSGSSVSGAQQATISYMGTTAPYNTLTTLGTTSVGTLLGGTSQIYGPDGTADGTVAQEFEAAFPATNGGTGNSTAVLATNADPYDALAASYLEAQLHTGLLITSPTSLGADAANALRIEGVKTVYVVGGPLAISQAVITQLEATPVYNVGGVTTTGANIKVVGPIYGTTADDTAQQLATYFGTGYGANSFTGAYTSNGIGAYNDTTGTGSTTAPSGTVPTAVVISDTDWQDAMSIAPEAYSQRWPVILTSATSLSSQASAALTSLGVKQVIVVGGQLALTNPVVSSIEALNGGISVLRIAGIDATDTAAQIANFAMAAAPSGLGLNVTTVLASHADYWSDALGSAALGGGANQATYGYEPLILVQNPTTVGPYTTTELGTLHKKGVTGITVLGGTLAMPSATVTSLQNGLAG